MDMTDNLKGVLINGIISALNDNLRRKNKELCQQNLYTEQTPLHGAEMFFKLAYMKDSDLNKIAKGVGL
jgi:hypothetical protein